MTTNGYKLSWDGHELEGSTIHEIDLRDTHPGGFALQQSYGAPIEDATEFTIGSFQPFLEGLPHFAPIQVEGAWEGAVGQLPRAYFPTRPQTMIYFARRLVPGRRYMQVDVVSVPHWQRAEDGSIGLHVDLTPVAPAIHPRLTLRDWWAWSVRPALTRLAQRWTLR